MFFSITSSVIGELTTYSEMLVSYAKLTVESVEQNGKYVYSKN